MEAKVAAQGEKVRKLKADKAPAAEIKAAVAELLALKEQAGIEVPKGHQGGKDQKKASKKASQGKSDKGSQPAAAAPAASGDDAVAVQAEKVRTLKANKASKEEIKAAVDELLALKAAAGIEVTKGHQGGKTADKGSSKGSKKEAAPSKGSKKEAAPSKKSSGGVPANCAHRMKIWDECAARRAKDSKPSLANITIKLSGGKTVSGKAGQTTPLDIANNSLPKDQAAKIVLALVNGKMHDVHRPIEADCDLELLDFNTPEGKHAFWHSSAHVLGQALELTFDNAKLCIGPPLEEGGFYYDVDLDADKVTPEHFKGLEKIITKVQSEKQPFVRLQLKKDEALEMFKHNKYKLEIIKTKVPDGEMCSAYRCGPLIDLCKGPHIPNTGLIKAMAVTKNSSAYWLGKAENASLQRVYGVSFPDKAQLKEYQDLMEEAERRDHRKVGVAQKLFFFHDLSPGSAFFLPHGARIYNKLQEFIRGEYRKRGYDEVISPNVFNIDLWKTSGHYANYKENMFIFDVEGQDFGMKPMNCPGHCLMFKSTLRSYRELPVRFADFGVLHRNELSGALTGLTRVRRFQQDDAHIFCRQDQIEQEVAGVLDFLQHAYGIFGYQFNLMLSTRPEKFLGELEVWDKAEMALAQALDAFGQEWTINPADGAFYGPKIDIQLTDALKRKHQCATIQLDFQLPLRFGLQYKAEGEGFEMPVIIHRAILGSVERQMAVLVEHTAGKWPLWLSPRQVMIVTVSEKFMTYGYEVRHLLHNLGFYVDIEESNKQLNKKIREAQLAQYNYILVLGAEEQDNRTVNVRNRDAPDDKCVWTLDELVNNLTHFVKEYK